MSNEKVLWDAEFNAGREAAAGVGLMGEHRGFRRLQKNVVEGESQTGFHVNPLGIQIPLESIGAASYTRARPCKGDFLHG